MEAIEKRGGALARPLRILVPLIKDELEAGDAAGIEHYRKAGEMLLEAKEQLPHGEFSSWAERNFQRSKTTLSQYMKLVEVVKSKPGRTFESVRQAVRPNQVRYPESRPPSWQEPVREVVSRVNVEALARERENREKEDRLLHQLAHQLIDIGYKVLAAQLHPDKKGGSADAMRRLNEVRRILKSAI